MKKSKFACKEVVYSLSELMLGIFQVATMAAVKELLLKTLSDLTNEELNDFKWFQQFKFFQRNLQHTLWRQLGKANSAGKLADVMVEVCGQKSVQVTVEVLVDMDRTDLAQRLLDSSSGLKKGMTCLVISYEK